MPHDTREDSVPDQEFNRSKPILDSALNFVAGTTAGIVGLAVGFPLDTVKVRYQDVETAPKYKGLSTLATVTKIVREERFLGLYKGITSPMASCGFLNGLIFSSNQFFLALQLRNYLVEPSITQIGLAGAGSGIVASSITCPTELIKIRQQLAITSRPSSREVTIQIIRKHGLRGLYRGFTATALRDSGYGIYFAAYEEICRILGGVSTSPRAQSSQQLTGDSEQKPLSWPRLLLAGGAAGVISWFATFGLDVVKTRVQSSDWSPTNPFRNTLSTTVNSYRSEGFRVFFTGLSPTLIRAFPVNMATFGTFELLVKVLSYGSTP